MKTNSNQPEQINTSHLAAITDICSAYLSCNQIKADEVPAFIRAVSNITKEIIYVPSLETPPDVVAKQETPAVPIEDSVTPEYLICLNDGKRFKSLKRHLMTSYGMSPEQYRKKWNLPSEYPMVSETYSQTRSTLAKSMGLGQQLLNRRRRTTTQGTKGSVKGDTSPTGKKPGRKAA